jgi:hypothetical protein
MRPPMVSNSDTQPTFDSTIPPVTIVRSLMQRFRLLLPLGVVAIAHAHCGGTVSLEKRPCPCTTGWTCCNQAQICVPQGTACPARPTAYCQAGWQTTDSWCVLDLDVEHADVCHFPDSPSIQVDLDGERDECASQPDLEGLYRSFDCNVTLGKSTVQGMVVHHGVQLVRPGKDGCRLRASLLVTEPLP